VTETRKAGRPRSTEADRSILRTTLELLAREGLRGLSVKRVAEQAGVGKTTIYRRYPSKQELVKAALGSLLAGEPETPPDTGSVRGDVAALAVQRRKTFARTQGHTLMLRLCVESATDPQLYRLIRKVFIDPARAPVFEILRRGIERGELDPGLDLELATDLLGGAFVYRLLISRSDLRAVRGTLENALDLLLDGVKRR
jgi:AcrR family transcriptional regulator